MRPFFGFFFVSGFCSILYELIWLRLAMAQFAVTTALVSIVLSAFMIGMGLGSWGAGRYIRPRSASSAAVALRLYALTELLIGVSAIMVRRELFWSRLLLEKLNAGSSFSVPGYYAAAGIVLGFILVPWCACIGATFSFAMAAIKKSNFEESVSSFSYLYLANVLGAMTGAVVPLLFIEKWGFHRTLYIGAALNVCLAACALALSFRRGQESTQPIDAGIRLGVALPKIATHWANFLLFATGLTSMGVELVWIRLFTPILGTLVYAFATILCLYLGATYLGSWWYRRSEPSENAPDGWMLAALGFSVVLPFLMCDPRLNIFGPLRVLSILPFSFLVGFVTPMVLDRVSQGNPDHAGQGYAINIAGCVLGPLVSGFSLLPILGERFTLLVYAIPWIVVSFHGSRSGLGTERGFHLVFSWKAAAIGLASLAFLAVTHDYASQFFPREVRRDSTATVTAIGNTRENKRLLVNGVGMTVMTPITKMIAHLPLAFLPMPPKDALVICFGMGTTHRSMLSWGISSTAVELVPSVVSVFPFFYADGAELLRSPRSHVVIDDGRFYLERSDRNFDVIVLDPPPPVQAAASSLLYSKEFYAVAREHLRADGILQQWYPGDSDPAIVAAVAKALRESFPYVRAFGSGEGGYHFLASRFPLPTLSAATLASRLPTSAAADLVEWGPALNAQAQFERVLTHEVSLDSLIDPASATPALQDDGPVNEYFLLRYLNRPDFRKKIESYFSHARG
jgi:spermidine synthase